MKKIEPDEIAAAILRATDDLSDDACIALAGKLRDCADAIRRNTCTTCGCFIGNENAKALLLVCECAVPSYPADDKPPQ